jgi:hypothetical protein
MYIQVLGRSVRDILIDYPMPGDETVKIDLPNTDDAPVADDREIARRNPAANGFCGHGKKSCRACDCEQRCAGKGSA